MPTSGQTACTPGLSEPAEVRRFFGRMNDPVAAAYVKGICGDEMEFYLVIREGIITDIRFFTDGCEITRLCGAKTASFANGHAVWDALAISTRTVTDAVGDLPLSHRHCPILAVTTLYKAIADYLLKP